MTEFLKRMLGYTRPYKMRLVIGLLCGVVFALTNAALPVTVKLVIDIVFSPTGTDSFKEYFAQFPWLENWIKTYWPQITSPTSIAGILLVIASVPLVMFVRGLFAYFHIYLMNWVASRAIADLRIQLFEHLQNLPLSFYNKANTGELLSRLSNDVAMLQTTISSSFAVMIKDPVTAVALVTVMVAQQPKLTLISLIVFPLCVVPIVIYGLKMRKSSLAIQTHTAELSTLAHESFTGTRIIKAYNLEPIVLQQFKNKIGQHMRQWMRVIRAQETPGPLIEFFAAIGIALVICYVRFYSQATVTSGGFLQFVLSIFLLYQPIKAISRLNGQLEQSRAASLRVFEILDTQELMPEKADPLPVEAINAPIRFEHVSFSYGDKIVLNDINMIIEPGQMVALVGPSGSGKTTLSNLLLRFYDPQKGCIRIGSTDIRDVSLKELRANIGVVTQETILFNETINYNIGLGKPGSNNEEIQEAAKHAYSHEFIVEKPLGYKTEVGEKGVVLSGGQRQRIAIARAILKNAPILILDEAMSALDTESERAVQAALEKLMPGRTTLCIAHRLSTIQKADKIVVLDEGRIVEQGKHHELIAKGGVYAKLYQLQFESSVK